MIDTLRSDRLGCYGYSRPTSPRIDRFASGATLFAAARAQSSWTRPAVASILSGLLPIAHQAERRLDRLPDASRRSPSGWRRAGYATAMVTANANTAGRFGFRQGFESLRLPAGGGRVARSPHVPGPRVNRHALRLARSAGAGPAVFPPGPHRRSPRPLHADPGVAPAARGRGGESRGSEARRRSASWASFKGRGRSGRAQEALGALRRRDRRQRRVVRRAARPARSARPGDRHAVVLTSDHGEEFFEHGGWIHGQTLYEEQLRIPLVVRLPGGVGAGRVVSAPAEQIDVAPTLLELAALPPRAGVHGRSLLAAMTGGQRLAARPSFAHLDRSDRRIDAVLEAQWKLIRRVREEPNLVVPPVELYALGSDPEERQSQIDDRPLRRAWLEGRLRASDDCTARDCPPSGCGSIPSSSLPACAPSVTSSRTLRRRAQRVPRACSRVSGVPMSSSRASRHGESGDLDLLGQRRGEQTSAACGSRPSRSERAL